jgi:hypothetical protein
MPPRSFLRSFALLLGFMLCSIPGMAWGAGSESAAPIDATPPGAPPERLWVVWLDGRSVDQAIATGARVIDRFPDAVIVADASSARTLRSSSFRVEPEVGLPPGRTVTLVRAHGRPAPKPLDAQSLAQYGIEVVWQSGPDAIIASDGPPAEAEALLYYHRQALGISPLRRSVAEAPAEKTLATDFAPIIQEMVDQVSGDALIQEIGRLAGRYTVTVGGSPVTFTTRSTPTAKCDQAEQYIFERFQAMGFTDVAYDPYTFSTTSARNVIATLPGVEMPQHIIIIGGHLDSTSPMASTNAPGANDNASGTAGVLAIADILRHYSFRSTIRFIAFTGEEQGLYGSTHYASAAAARGDLIDGAVIFDMIGWKNALNQIDIEGGTSWLPIMNVMNDACARYTGLATQIQLFSFGSDHVPFQNQGFPAFLAIETEYNDYPCYHQTCDTTGWNQPVFTADVVRAGLATVAQLAGPLSFYISHSPLLSTENTVGPYDAVATISKISALVADSLQLHWSTGGAFTNVPLTPMGPPDQYHASIPGQPGGTVSYWLSARDIDGRLAVHPIGAPAVLNHFTVAPRVTLLAEGFESGAGGWTHGGTLDDWQIGAPGGLTEDPAAAYSGTQIAGTDLTGLGATPGRYENLCESWLESPPVDCSNASQVRLSFARKLAVERSNGGNWDFARVLVNGATIWESPSAANLNDPAWTPQTLDLSGAADGNPSVRVRFTMHSDQSVNFGGWNLDDILITGIVPQPVLDVATGIAAREPLLLANAPNPGHAGTTLRFDLPKRDRVDLAIYDVRGRLVRTLVEGSLGLGHHEVVWDGRDASGTPSAVGVYFYRLATSTTQQTRRMILLR